MKKISKLFIMTIISGAFALSGCQKAEPPKASEPVPEAVESEAPEPSEAAQSETPPSDKIIVMGTNAEFAPFEFIAEDGIGLVGNIDGVDVAIALKIAEKLGAKLEIENMAFDSLIFALPAGKIDFVAAGMTVDEERSKSVDFSEKYYKAIQKIIVPVDNEEIKLMKDLENKTVGVQLGTTGDFIITDEVAGVTMNRYNRGIDGVLDLKTGKIDAVVIDALPAEMFVKNNSDLKIVDAPDFPEEEYAIAVKKGNTELLDVINETINEMKANGEIEELVINYSK